MTTAHSVDKPPENPPGPITAVMEEPYHYYLSTACLHGQHGYCQSTQGANGPKIPGVCKFCTSPCICRCHREGQ